MAILLKNRLQKGDKIQNTATRDIQNLRVFVVFARSYVYVSQEQYPISDADRRSTDLNDRNKNL